MVAEPDERLETFDQLFVGDDTALSARQPRQFPIRYRPAVQLEKGAAVRHVRQGRHNGLTLAEAFGVKLGVCSPQPGADHHAELTGTAQSHNQLVSKGRRIRWHELHLKHSLQIACHGIPQRLSVQPLICDGSRAAVALDPLGVAFRNLGQHAADGGSHMIRRFRHDAHASHLGLVHDGGGYDFQHRPFSGQSHDLLFHRPRILGNEGTPGRSFRTRKRKQVIHLILIEKSAPFLRRLAEQFRYGLIFNFQMHCHDPCLKYCFHDPVRRVCGRP